MSRSAPHDLGIHRVVEPEGVLPQAARRLDASGPVRANEIAIDVERLNIDSASFEQIVEEVGADEEAVGNRIAEIVGQRGKMQNPVTGSGGMLLGRIEEVGPDYDGPVEVDEGTRIATLVSLTLTPLGIDRITGVDLQADQVAVEATAYLWPSAPIVEMPMDLDDRLALSVLDVCGAPAQTRRLVDSVDRLLVIGTGKSGILSAAAARKQRGSDLQILGVDLDGERLASLKEAGLFDQTAVADAGRPVEVLEAVERMTGGRRVDLAVNTCNVEETEMATVLAVRQGGTAYFFNMATDFSKAALGAEGVGRDIRLLMGNGYTRGHADYALGLVRSIPAVRRRLEQSDD